MRNRQNAIVIACAPAVPLLGAALLGDARYFSAQRNTALHLWMRPQALQ